MAHEEAHHRSASHFLRAALFPRVVEDEVEEDVKAAEVAGYLAVALEVDEEELVHVLFEEGGGKIELVEGRGRVLLLLNAGRSVSTSRQFPTRDLPCTTPDETAHPRPSALDRPSSKLLPHHAAPPHVGPPSVLQHTGDSNVPS